MTQASTLDVGMDVQKDAIAVASIAQEPLPRSFPSAPSVRASVTSTRFSAACRPQAHISSSSTQRVLVAIGSIALYAQKTRSARWWPPP